MSNSGTRMVNLVNKVNNVYKKKRKLNFGGLEMKNQPNIYRALKHLSQAYEERKKHHEKLSGLKPDQAQIEVEKLQLNLKIELDSLASKISFGELG